MREWKVWLFCNATWDYYGEPEYFATRREALAWIEKRKLTIAENDCEAHIFKGDQRKK